MQTRSRALIVGVILVVLLLAVVLGDLLLRRGGETPSTAPSSAVAPVPSRGAGQAPSGQAAPPAAVAAPPQAQAAPPAAVAAPPKVQAAPPAAVAVPSAAAASREGHAAAATPPTAAKTPLPTAPAPVVERPVPVPVPLPVVPPAAAPPSVPAAPPAAPTPAPKPAPKPAPVLPGKPAPPVPQAAPVTPVRPCVLSAGERMALVAVLPVENLSGTSVPAAEVKQLLVGAVTSAGVRVLDDAALDALMTRHHVRYEAGVDDAIGRALKDEAQVDGVLVSTFEFSNETAPPKVALITRLVSLKGAPTVVWANDVGLAGDDAPGLFALRQINDYKKLEKKALDEVTGSLAAYLKTGARQAPSAAAGKFKPKTAYRKIVLEAGKTYTIAVVPFFNLSERRTAGEVLAMLFVRHFSALPQFCVVDPGVVHQQLLDARVIMDSGLSLADAETVAAPVDADFVLSGRVTRYVDYEGPSGLARVEFSTVLIDKRSGKVVWSSESYNDGRDGIGLFERGMSKTAHGMATQMVRLTTELIAGRGR